MSRVLFLRHAKANWPEPGMRDFDRPLAPRGMTDAGDIGAIMRAGGYHPDRVICSAARRTRETLRQIAGQLQISSDRQTFTDDLYDSDAGRYLESVRSAGDGVETVLVIGHNPMIEDIASALAAGGDENAMQRLDRGFPTSGLAVIKIDGPLRDVALSSGYLEAFLLPSDPPKSGDGA